MGSPVATGFGDGVLAEIGGILGSSHSSGKVSAFWGVLLGFAYTFVGRRRFLGAFGGAG
jgi:uncharacterized membrane protein (UPF0136 family)